MKKIVEMLFGSHLYGTDGPNSDHDFKGVFMPTSREIALQRVPKSINHSTKRGVGRNTNEDVDTEFYSLHYFLNLACAGETVALDMLHAPAKALTQSTPLWMELTRLRERFYTKNLRAFVGYARRQAAKYGVKGSRLADAKLVLEFLRSNAQFTVNYVWNVLPEGEHIQKTENENGPIYIVCGKALVPNALCSHYIPMLEKFTQNYGDRAKQAEQNAGVDWKAVSHAFRAGYQVKHILTHGGYSYPLPETDYLIRVKNGELHFRDEVGPALDALMDELEVLTTQSTLPEKVDREYWDNWLVSVLKERELV